MAILEKISSLAKRRGFVYPSSEIYGGLAGFWDYGPLGVLLKQNIKKEFWKQMVSQREDVVGLDASIIMNPRVWEASGHLESFSDQLVECKECHKRFRADKLPDTGYEPPAHQCPDCGGTLTEPKQFNLMTEVYLGTVEGKKQKAYLRGEITQGVHVNFKNVIDSTRLKIPFGIAQIGKAFRNEITPGHFTFRSREFEQMELQYYIKPDDKEAEVQIAYWKNERLNWYASLGLRKKNLRLREHKADERAHYARAAWDIEYNLDGEWKELEGIHDRGDWDLRRHQEFSKQDLTYYDEETGKRFLPRIIETSGGVDRAALFFLADAYREEQIVQPSCPDAENKTKNKEEKEEKRIVLKLHPSLAPYQAAVFPLLANKPKLVTLARAVYNELKQYFMIAWDARGNIGKRYRAQDEIGTPYCVTVDFESLEKNDVTVRDRDSMQQERIPINGLKEYFSTRFNMV